MTKISILYDISDKPWGGGNQFLAVFRDFLFKINRYEKDPHKADIILVNSKDNLTEATRLKEQEGKTLVHRIDGVFCIYRGKHELKTDQMVYDFNEKYADGTIFQSEWSRGASKKNGMKHRRFETVIKNCTNSRLFFNNRSQRRRLRPQKKCRLITTSWSDNPKKGFGIYEQLDEKLDFEKYEYVFIGRSPNDFKNIKSLGVLGGSDIAKELHGSDVFVTASEDDACSNSLVEAMSCGLPAVGLASGGNSEIIGNGGELFNSIQDVMDKIEKVSCSLSLYESRVDIPLSFTVCCSYRNFMKEVYEIVSGKH